MKKQERKKETHLSCNAMIKHAVLGVVLVDDTQVNPFIWIVA